MRPAHVLQRRCASVTRIELAASAQRLKPEDAAPKQTNIVFLATHPYTYLMSTKILFTKLFAPPPRSNVVVRPRLIERLNKGLRGKLTLVSAPAGFGKSTLVSDWLARCGQQAAWLSLDEGDADPARFLTYFIAALQTITSHIGVGVLGMLESPQPLAGEATLTALINEITAIPNPFVLILDDYHVVDSSPVDASLKFLLEHLPPQMHLVMTTREDPQLPLARLRARGQLTELRAADLRFTPGEAAEFLNGGMGLSLSEENITALESRTEGWIAGLQLAALSMQGHPNTSDFIKSFTGSHHFVLDYLAEEVLHQQPDNIQTFLLRTSILDRLCGPLCDAVLNTADGSGQAILETIEQANLFLAPLDNERRWYRYHPLFADLLRQRLRQGMASSSGQDGTSVAEHHQRASQWYEDNGLELEAFHHATASNDVGRAERLIAGAGMPLHFRGQVAPVLNWLATLPRATMDARPSLWVTYASACTMIGQPVDSVEAKLQAAEAALQAIEPDDSQRDLVGQIASIRAMLAIPLNQVETIVAESRRALEFLHPRNHPVRTTTLWTLGFAYQLRGDRAAASAAYTEAIAISQASGNVMIGIAASTCLGQVQESQIQFALASTAYQRVLELAGDPPWPFACEAFLGLGRICYEQNDLVTAQQHGERSLLLARQMVNVDTPAVCGVFLARLKLAEGDADGATTLLAQTEQFVREHHFAHRLPAVIAAQVRLLLHQGYPESAARLAENHDLPLSHARIRLAQGDASAALTILESHRQQVEARDWLDERLRIMVLQAVAYHASGEMDRAVQRLADALALAQPGNLIRTFVDEGLPRALLLAEAAVRGIMPGYTQKLLAALDAETRTNAGELPLMTTRSPQLLPEPLSDRELEILRLVADGLSNREISEQLFLALDTIKGHNSRIYAKLAVQRRTEAVARAQLLGLL